MLVGINVNLLKLLAFQGSESSRANWKHELGNWLVAMLALIGGHDDYDQWVGVGMAAFVATGGSWGGYEAWREWSRQSDKYEESSCQAKWLAFSIRPPSRTGGAKLLSLALHADPAFLTPSLAARLAKAADPHAELRNKLRSMRQGAVVPQPDPDGLRAIAGIALDNALAAPRRRGRPQRLFHDTAYNSSVVRGAVIKRYRETGDLAQLANDIANNAVSNAYRITVNQLAAILGEISGK